MELTKTDFENIYANVTLRKGAFVTREDYALKACEMYPGCGVTADNVHLYLDKAYDKVKYLDNFRADENDPEIRALRINLNRIERFARFRDLLWQSVIKSMRPDGFAPVASLGYDSELISAMADLKLGSVSYALSLQPLEYSLSVKDGVQLVHPNKLDSSLDVRALVDELDREIESCIVNKTDSEGWAPMNAVSKKRISEILATIHFDRLRRAVECLLSDRYECALLNPADSSEGVKIRRLDRQHPAPAPIREESGAPQKEEARSADPADVEALRKKIVALIESGKDADGWLNMAQIGGQEVKELMKKTGYGKSLTAIRNLMPEDFEIAPVNPTFPTGAQKIRMKGQKIKEPNLPAGALKPLTEINKKKSAYEKLISFALIYPYNDVIKALAEKALPESWHFGGTGVENYSILKNYFQLTFERLVYEDVLHKDQPEWKTKIRYSADKKFCIFNTGLVDRLYEPIYAYFARNTRQAKDGKVSADWVFKGFVGSEDTNRQAITRHFGTELPDPAHYYDSTDELVFNIKWEIGTINWVHIIERCERLPEAFLEDNISWLDDVRTAAGRAIDYKKLSARINSETRTLNRIKNRIEDAIDMALKRVHWNFKTAIPIYYPTKHKISLLLPLSLVDGEEGKADVAMVFEATGSGAYIGHTILTLKMAYNNARLITRPDSDWLTASQIDSEGSLPDDRDGDD